MTRWHAWYTERVMNNSASGIEKYILAGFCRFACTCNCREGRGVGRERSECALQAPGVLKAPAKTGKTRRSAKGTTCARLHRSASPVVVPTTSRAAVRVPTPKQLSRVCIDAAATAAAIKDRNHAAIKAHVHTRGAKQPSRCTGSFSDEATTNRIARCATAWCTNLEPKYRQQSRYTPDNFRIYPAVSTAPRCARRAMCYHCIVHPPQACVMGPVGKA